MATSSIGLPKLPELDREDLKSVRAFLPGKLLGRASALLALSIPLLASGTAVDQALQYFGVERPPSLSLYITLLFGLPLIAVGAQLFIEWWASQKRRALQRLAV